MNRAIQVRRADEDMQLACACARGDRLAQRELFHQQRSRVHRTLFRIMGSNRHMDDLMQDTFVEVLRSVGSFSGRSSLATWVDTIAARVAYRHLARRSPERSDMDAVAELVAQDCDAESSHGGREAMRRLYAVLDRLEAKYRIAYTLYLLDGRSLEDVAKLTGATKLAVKNRVWRARKLVEARARRDALLAEYLPATEDKS